MLPEGQFDPDVTSSVDAPALARAKAMSPETAGTVIDRYHLLEKIGEGGMGEVWLAEQKEPVRRRVALKLVKAGMNTREVLGRFESERQALALMEHPAIAKVFDAGSTPQGASYFVMEYVPGVPITDYCDNHRLSIAERLDLFVRVCEGVRHAHQKAVIHRDLKPSNILVAEMDSRAMPKIIDFGVAKALGQKLTEHTMFTRVGVLVGTPEYMSPEQALSSGEDVDTRTDVYSLGVIFYELLAGAPPIELRKIAFDEFLRRLRDEEPTKPSTKIRTGDPATSTELALKRQTEPVALAKQVGGDLDSIALKALEKDRSRRYGSASDFAADIERYLRHEAVQAVAPSPLYRARKFARRHRWGLVMACAFAVVLAAAATISIRQSIRANREAAVAEAVNDFLRNDLLAQASASGQASPSTKPDLHLEVRTALDRAAAKIAGRFDQQPEIEAAIRSTIGQTYEDLGLYPEARAQFERARELYRQVLGPENLRTLAVSRSLGGLARMEGKNAEAETILTETLAIQRRVLGPDHPETMWSMLNLSAVYSEEGKYPQGEALAAQLLEIQRRISGPQHPDTLKVMNNLALLYHEQGKYDQAEKLDIEILDIRRRVLGPEHPDTLGTMNNLAMVYNAEGKYADAEALDRQTLDVKRHVLGPDHPDTLMAMNNLAVVEVDEGKFADAEALDREVLKIRSRVLGPEHPNTLQSMHNLALVNYSEGQYSQAEALFRRTVELRQRVLGPEHPKTLLSMWDLADAYAVEHKYAESESLFSRTLEISRRVLGPEHPRTLSTLEDFAFMYQQKGNYAMAESIATEVLAGEQHSLGPEHPSTLSSKLDLALARISQRKYSESEPTAREALAVYEKKLPEDWQRFRAESLLGASLAGQRKYTDAEPLLVQAYEGMSARKAKIAVPDRYHMDRAREWLIQFYVASGKPQKAAELRKGTINK